MSTSRTKRLLLPGVLLLMFLLACCSFVVGNDDADADADADDSVEDGSDKNINKRDECNDNNGNSNYLCHPPASSSLASHRVPDTCHVAYAPLSTTGNDVDDEWGVFSLVDRPKGSPVWNYGDVVIQIVDASLSKKDSSVSSAFQRLLVWNGQETGGHYEGHQTVYSVVPGLGMMGRSTSSSSSSTILNLIPFAPRYDEGGLTRFDSPGAGAITHYHNYTWFFRSDVSAGDELVLSSALMLKIAEDTTKRPTLQDIKQHGYCMDNLRPKTSRIKEAGRGAFATGDIPQGSIVAPVPVIPISSSVLETNDNSKKQQLLINYCLGHKNSTTLLFPYGPRVNLINHFSEPNVKFVWSEKSKEYLSKPLPQDNESFPHLMLELVATRDIREGEEVFLDYGKDWEEAWWNHVREWKPSDMHYTPSYVMDDAARLLRTQQEQKEHEYPDNVFTSCFYRYSDRSEEEKSLSNPSGGVASSALSTKNDHNKVASFRWELTKGLYDLKNLRPCQVLKRFEDQKGRSAYAVHMLNRPGLPPEEIIPKGSLHVVTHVPRQAIRFSDKAGTTDQHLPNAFRHKIGLGDDLFPKAWRDLEMDNV